MMHTEDRDPQRTQGRDLGAPWSPIIWPTPENQLLQASQCCPWPLVSRTHLSEDLCPLGVLGWGLSHLVVELWKGEQLRDPHGTELKIGATPLRQLSSSCSSLQPHPTGLSGQRALVVPFLTLPQAQLWADLMATSSASAPAWPFSSLPLLKNQEIISDGYPSFGKQRSAGSPLGQSSGG